MSPLPGTRSARRRPRRLAAAAVVTAAALVLGACAASDDGDAAFASDPGPGVSAEEVRIGFIMVNKATAGGSGGFVVPDQGDAKAQINALVKAVNADGGIAGRTVVPVVKTFESSTASPQTEAALCTAFTDDDKVFAVVMTGQRSPSTRTCYKKANTVVIDLVANAQAKSVYEDNKPYYWTPDAPTLETHLTSLVTSLQDQGFFEGDVKVGVIAEKGPQYSGAVNDVLLPALEAAGANEVERAEVDQSTPDAAATTSRQTVSAFKKAGVDRVVFAGRADNAGYITGTALPQKYFPRLAISTFETPNFSLNNPAFFPAQSLEGAVGTGLAAAKDGVKTLAFPGTDAEKACVKTFEDAGITFQGRDEADDALRFCDAVSFLAAAGAAIGTGPLNASAFEKAAFGLGTTWQAAATFGTEFAEGVYAPTSKYRELAYKDGKFAYTSEIKTLAAK